jgi:Flp pilus assembly CpaF family ATPase
MTANVGLPHRSVREAIALAIRLVVHIARVDGLRKVTEVVSVHGYDSDGDRFKVATVNNTAGRRSVAIDALRR